MGFGAIVFSIEDNNTNSFIPVHTIKYANKNIVPSVSQPAFKLFYGVNTTISTSTATLKMTSGAIFNEGEVVLPSNIFSKVSNLVSTSDANETHVLSLKNARTFKGKGNNIVTKIRSISFENDSSKGCAFQIYLRPTLTAYNWQYINQDSSCTLYSDTAESWTTGTLIFSTLVSSNNQTLLILHLIN